MLKRPFNIFMLLSISALFLLNFSCNSSTKNENHPESSLSESSEIGVSVTTSTQQTGSTVTTSNASINPAASLTELRAFPGAEGFGSNARGGRGGRVIEVTNLNDSGPGSLRAACEADGPRIVVFRTGGTIKLGSVIKIKRPNITIAGQTAPGTGISLRGAGLVVSASEVIIRGLRFRIGDGEAGPNPMNRDGIIFHGGRGQRSNIIVDHCSFNWAVDENVSFYKDCRNITVQYCIIAEGLLHSLHPNGVHSMGLLVTPGGHDISIHHNLFAHNKGRSPKIAREASGEIINNVVYNWLSRGTFIDMNARANLIGNVYKPGPSTHREGGKGYGATLRGDDHTAKVYLKDNIGPNRESNSGDEWLIISGNEAARSMQPVLTPSNVQVTPVDAVYELVLANAGATIPARDPIDMRVVNEVRNNGGKLLDSQRDIGGWPEMPQGTPPEDSDKDGMPDEWEKANGLNPNAKDGNADVDGDGYTNIEAYINSLIPIPGAGNR